MTDEPARDSNVASRRYLYQNKLRQATLIIPKTGERIKKTFTLRNAPTDLNGDNDETQPLLAGRVNSFHLRPAGRFHRFAEYIKNGFANAFAFAISPMGQNILKCSIAYLLGSMATFLGPIRDSLGQNDGKHMVATITVYFHPARSAGSMEEATLLALAAFLYAAFISFTSMGVSFIFGQINHIMIGHAIVLVVFCGGGLGLVGWLKQRLGNPLVNVACSLTSLAIITILTKEGSIQRAMISYEKVLQVLKMVLMGIFCSVFVSLTIRPVSARKQLREDFREFSDLIADMLTDVTRGFLTGSERELGSPEFQKTSSKFQSVFTSMTTDLGEAKYEHYFLGTERQYWIEARLVRCMERLSQSIGGLRSASNTQFSLIIKSATGGGPMSPRSGHGPEGRRLSLSFPNIVERMRALSAIEEAENESGQSGSTTPDGSSAPPFATLSPGGIQSATTTADIFSLFIAHLGPPMKSLAYTLKEMLGDLPFGPAPESKITIDSHFRTSLIDAMELFKSARLNALNALYAHRELTRNRSLEVEADFEEVAASCGYFSASLQDFAEDMLVYLDALEELDRELNVGWKGRSWNWLLPWRRVDRRRSLDGLGDLVRGSRVNQNVELGLSRVRPIIQRKDSVPHIDPRKKTQRIVYKIWRALAPLRREDIKYAVKVGIGAILYAMWSFIPATQIHYSHWRGEWGLLSYMLVCSMTIGASNTTGYQRTLGTCLGAVCAIVAWHLAEANPFLLAFFGWLVSLWCFYIIVGKGKGPMGRFILLTYNLSALYAYSISVRDEEDDDDEGGPSPLIWEIVLHRVVAVTIGCIWGIIVTRLIWPISARRKLKNGLSLLWLRMGLIWKRDPLAMLLEEGDPTSYMDIRESIRLQRFLAHLEALCNAAPYEFEFKGPFPTEQFKKILQATRRMLDSFHAMNTVLAKDLKASAGETLILRYTKHERMQLSLRISHLFSVIASSMKLEYPLNDAVPNTEYTRDQLLAKLFEFRMHGPDRESATDEDYELFYTHVLVTGQVALDIEIIGRELEQMYGVLNEDNLKLN